MKRVWLFAAGIPAVMLLVYLVLVLLPSGDGSGRGAKVNAMYQEALQAYESRERVELHWTVSYVSQDGREVQQDSKLWRSGGNWLLESVLPDGDSGRQIIQLQYGDLLFTEYDGTVSCQTTTIPGVGQLNETGFDTWEQTETGGWIISWDHKPTDAQQSRGIIRAKGSMELDKAGNLIRVLTREYHKDQPGHLETDFRIIPGEPAACEEKIEEAYQRMKTAAERP